MIGNFVRWSEPQLVWIFQYSSFFHDNFIPFILNTTKCYISSELRANWKINQSLHQMTLWLFSLQSKICIANQIYSNSFRQVFKYKSIYYPTSNQQHPFTLCSMTRLHSYFSIWWHLTRIKMLLDKSSPRKSPAIPSTKSNPFALPRVTARAGQSILLAEQQSTVTVAWILYSFRGNKIYNPRSLFAIFTFLSAHFHSSIDPHNIYNESPNERMNDGRPRSETVQQ